jgi:hypothetical protein
MPTSPLHLLALDALARPHGSGLPPRLRDALLSGLAASLRAGGEFADLRSGPLLAHGRSIPAASAHPAGRQQARPALRVVP